MKPGRTAGRDLQRRHRGAGRRERGKRVGFGVEGVDRVAILAVLRVAPMPAGAGWFGERAPDAGGGGELIGRRVAAENLPDLEQSDVGETAVGIFLRGGDKTGNETWAH